MQSGLDGAADHQAESLDHLIRPGKLQLRDVRWRHGAITHFVEIFWRVDESQIVPDGRLRLDAILRPDDSCLEKPCVNQRVLLGGKNVRPDIDAIPGRVDDSQIPGAAACPTGRVAFLAGRTSEATG